MEPRISAITLGVSDLDRSIAFYRALGLEPAQTADEVAFFELNGFVLCLFTGLADDAGIEPRPAGLSALAYNVREAAEIDALLALVGPAGGTVLKAVHDTDWGGRSSYFADPDGHLWEVAWNPFWTIDSDGNTTLT